MSTGLVLAPQRERSLLLRTPLIAAAGTVGYGREVSKALPLDKLGAVITNTTTLRPRAGAPQPRLVETPAGLLLCTGLQNPGLHAILRHHARSWERLSVPVILSLAAESAKEFAYCAGLAAEVESVAGLELEPDLLADGEDMVQVVDAVRSATALPLLVHVPVGQPQAVAVAIVDLTAVGCDAVILGSPWPGLAMDQASGKPALSGDVLGPAIRPLALRLVYETAQLLDPDAAPIIAAGGVSSAADVAAFLAAGAQAVLLDTVIYVDPAAVTSIAEGASRR